MMNGAWVDRYLARRSVSQVAIARSVHGASGMRIVKLPQGHVRVRVVDATGARAGAAPVAFVCDGPIGIEHHAALFDRVTRRRRAVCFEPIGLGFSRPSASFGFTLEEQTVATEGVLRAIGGGPFILAFSCVGAYVALGLAARCPELVDRLLLIQAPSWTEERRWARRIDFRGRGLVAKPYLGQALMALGRERVAARWFAKALGPDASAAEFSRVAHVAMRGGAAWALASLVQEYFGDGAELPSLRIDKPTLVLWGAADTTHHMTDRRSMQAHAPGARFVQWDRAGHFPELEQPDLFCELLEGFAEQGCA
jgi:pimeloyl-ACP methyl ester carboxylesterase